MSISFPLSLPASRISRMSFRDVKIVGFVPSPWTGQGQVQEHTGEWFEADVTLAPMKGADADNWRAFFSSLRGTLGTFLLGDTGHVQRGAFGGTPIVEGAHAAGVKTLAIEGFGNSVTAVICAGDYVQVGSSATQRMYRALATVNSSGSGTCTIDIFPALHEALADHAAITTTAPKAVFRLVDAVSVDCDGVRIYGFGFKCAEAL